MRRLSAKGATQNPVPSTSTLAHKLFSPCDGHVSRLDFIRKKFPHGARSSPVALKWVEISSSVVIGALIFHENAKTLYKTALGYKHDCATFLREGQLRGSPASRNSSGPRHGLHSQAASRCNKSGLAGHLHFHLVPIQPFLILWQLLREVSQGREGIQVRGARGLEARLNDSQRAALDAAVRSKGGNSTIARHARHAHTAT